MYAHDLGTDKSEFDIFNQVNLTLVSENAKKYTQNNTLDFGLSMFFTNLGMINSSEMMS